MNKLKIMCCNLFNWPKCTNLSKCTSKCSLSPKCVLMGINFIFAITGIIMLSVGISTQFEYEEYRLFLTAEYFALPAFCIATGIIIFVITAFGFCAVLKEKCVLRILYVGAMVVMFIFHLSACIAGFVLRIYGLSVVYVRLRSTMALYVPNDYFISKSWDAVQRNFECCGVTRPTDWLEVLNTQDTQGLPLSCCQMVFGAVHSFQCTVQNAYRYGCLDVFGNFLDEQMYSIGVAGAVLTVIQGLLVACAIWALRKARAEKTTDNLLARREKPPLN